MACETASWLIKPCLYVLLVPYYCYSSCLLWELPIKRLTKFCDIGYCACRYPFEHVSDVPAKPFCFTERYEGVKKVLVDTFFGPPDVGVYSPSVQNTLFLMAKAVLNRLISYCSQPHQLLPFNSIVFRQNFPSLIFHVITFPGS